MRPRGSISRATRSLAYRPSGLNGAPGAKGLKGWPGRARLKYCCGVIGFGDFSGLGGCGSPGILLNGICLIIGVVRFSVFREWVVAALKQFLIQFN